MSFSQTAKLQFSLLLTILTLILSASPTVAASQLQATKFEIVPLTCVTKYKGQLCLMNIKLDWQLNKASDVCFYQNDQQLACWNNKREHTQKFQIQLQENSVFSLKTRHSNQEIIKQTVKINFINQYRRRLRPQWSIF